MKKKITIVMMGDSITDAGRDRERPTEDFGNGYAAMTAAMLREQLPQVDFTFVNQGLNGNTTPQCAERWDTDVAAYDPDYVTLMIGVNDAYAFSLGVQAEQLCAKAYRETLDNLVTHAFAKGAKKILFIMPYYVGKPGVDTEIFNKDTAFVLPAYRRAFRSIANKYGMPCIDAQKILQRASQGLPDKYLSPDYVHLNTYGNAVLANHVVKALADMIKGK